MQRQVTGDKFAVQVSGLAPAMIDVACSEDGLQTKSIAGLNAPSSPFGDEEDDEDDLEVSRTRLTVREAELDKKVAAVRCLGAMAKYCSAAFIPFLPQAVAAFEGLMEYVITAALCLWDVNRYIISSESVLTI